MNGFDYAVLNEAQAQEARATAERIRSRMKANIIENGLDLIGVKAQIGHGAFGSWIKAEFGMDEKTAQNYMRAASVFGGNSEIVSVLPSTIIYKLAAKTTPETIREDVLRQIGEGQRPKPAVIRQAIDDAKQQEKERQEAEKEAARLAKLTDEQRAELEKKAKRQRRTREQREAEAARERAEWKAKRERQEHAAQEAAELLADRFGDDLGDLLALIREAGSWQLDVAIQTLKDRPRKPDVVAEAMPSGEDDAPVSEPIEVRPIVVAGRPEVVRDLGIVTVTSRPPKPDRPAHVSTYGPRPRGRMHSR